MRATQSIRRLWPVLVLCTVSACGGGTSNPITSLGGASGASSGDSNSGFNSGVTVPPGTPNPTPSSAITRSEPTEGGETGDGFVTVVSYDDANDTFTVDNIAFDGSGPYARDDQVPGQNGVFPFAVYEAAAQVTDPLGNTTVNQFEYKAIYGVNGTGDLKFAIVRSGGYLNYGFGGFIYQRDGGVTLPTTGQAKFTGDYMGLRDFDGRSGLEYTVADMEINIDFEDFNDGNAVKGGLRDRRIFDSAGNEITQQVIDAFNTANNTSVSALPVVLIDVTTGSVSTNGEIQGTVQSIVPAGTVFESGTYYAILSGTDAAEVVGVLAITSDDPRFENVTVRETGGFILAR